MVEDIRLTEHEVKGFLSRGNVEYGSEFAGLWAQMSAQEQQ